MHPNIFGQVKKEISKVIIGQTKIIDQITTCFFANGHVIIRGVPGLGKTLLIKAIAKIFDLNFNRIQFTPDLMPSDILGYEILDPNKKQLKFIKGPIFTNILLADEINRTPPKTQSALLEAMQEKKVTIMGKTYSIDEPFIVLATENPIEQEGTYPLPEAQLDRFMFLVEIKYPSYKEEVDIVTNNSEERVKHLKRLFTKKQILDYKKKINNIKISEKVVNWVVKIVQATRPNVENFKFSKYIKYGAGPRAGKFIIDAAKSNAFLTGNKEVLKDNIKDVFIPVLKHRLFLNLEGETQEISKEEIINELLKIKI